MAPFTRVPTSLNSHQYMALGSLSRRCKVKSYFHLRCLIIMTLIIINDLMNLKISSCTSLVSSKKICLWIFLPLPGTSLFISLLIYRNLFYNILEIANLFCLFPSASYLCLCSDSLTRNLYFDVIKLSIFAFYVCFWYLF